jgi:hypothetical protein
MENNISLLPYNTFGMNVSADQFARFDSIVDMQSLISRPEIINHPILVL